MRRLGPMLRVMALLLCLGALAARGDEGAAGSSAEPHRWRLAATAGVGSAFHNAYFLVGGLVGYELALGFTAQVSGQAWLGSTPGLFKLSPGLTWYAPVPLLHPYLGGFYSHWFVGSGLADQDTVGLRAGLQVATTGPAAVDAGIAYERRLSCDVDCDSWWPELTAGIRF